MREVENLNDSVEIRGFYLKQKLKARYPLLQFLEPIKTSLHKRLVVKSISHLPYGERLKKLNLTTLYYRRQRADVLQVFRIIKGIDKLDIGNFFELNC